MKGVKIENDPKVGYETNSILRSFSNIFLVPVLNLLPVSIRPILRRTHKSAAVIIDHATSHKAMEVLYDRRRERGNLFQEFFLSIWLNTNNSKAVRNRLRLVKKEMKRKIAELVAAKSDVKILNIASGSARSVLEAVGESPSLQGVNLSATFVDMNHEAISYSQELARDHNHKEYFRWVKTSAQEFFKTNTERFNIIETVGLFEYLRNSEISDIISYIYQSLDPEGIVIVANIKDNIEKKFISKVVGWKMIYRDADELSSLLISGGFSLDKMKIYYEPQGIHCVIVAKK